MEHPGHITAVLLARADRIGLAVRAAYNFQQQTYQDKTLVVCGDDATIAELKAAEVRATFVAHPNLGVPCSLKLLASVATEQVMATEGGTWVTFWDDDILFHPGRLTAQLSVAQKGLPSFLCSSFWHYYDTDELFAYCLERRNETLQERVIPTTMVAHFTDLLPFALKEKPMPVERQYGRSPTGTLARSVLHRCKDGTRLFDQWWWAVVGVRGDNASGYDWHRHWVNTPKCRDVAWFNANREAVIERLAAFPFDRPLELCGRDGVAYSYIPENRWPEGTLPIGGPTGIEIVREGLHEQ